MSRYTILDFNQSASVSYKRRLFQSNWTQHLSREPSGKKIALNYVLRMYTAFFVKELKELKSVRYELIVEKMLPVRP